MDQNSCKYVQCHTKSNHQDSSSQNSQHSHNKRQHKHHHQHYTQDQCHTENQNNNKQTYKSRQIYSVSKSKSKDHNKQFMEHNSNNYSSYKFNKYVKISSQSSNRSQSRQRKKSSSFYNHQNSFKSHKSYKISRSRSKSYNQRKNYEKIEKSYAKSKQYKKTKRYRSISSSSEIKKHHRKHKKRSHSEKKIQNNNDYLETLKIHSNKEKLHTKHHHFPINKYKNDEDISRDNTNKSNQKQELKLNSPQIQYNYKSSSSNSSASKTNTLSQKKKNHLKQNNGKSNLLRVQKFKEYDDFSHSQRYSEENKNKNPLTKQKKQSSKKHYSKSQSSYSSKSCSYSSSNNKSYSSSSSSSNKNRKYRDKDEGHYDYKIGEIISNQKNKYKIISKIADGTFGRVFKVMDQNDEREYALKMIRAVPRYVKSAKIEVDILKDILSRKEGIGKEFVVEFKQEFEFKENYCMVFELLGLSLYEFQKKNDYKGYPINYVQSFFRQILESIKFLHESGLVHTDLKTENVVLTSSKYKYGRLKSHQDNNNFYHNDDKKSISSTCSQSIDKQHKQQEKFIVPKYTTVKLIDFGGAIYDEEYHSSIINTRQYRAPEVILGLQWDNKTDVWSIACIILELYSGDLYFPTHENYEHLAMIYKSSGNFPQYMINRCSSEMEKYFSQKHMGGAFYLNWPKYAKNTDSIKRVARFKAIDDIISKKYTELADLLKQMLEIDPKERISCAQALNHEFFTKKYKNEFYFC